MALLLEAPVHQWTRSEYYKMAEAGFFAGKHVELIEGQVIDMSLMGSLHRTSVLLTGEALRQIFHEGYFVSTQCPMDFGDISEPEPDVTVIAGQVRDYTDAHPATAVLIVEVADTSLRYDRTVKASLYARAGIAEYWLLNLQERQLEVYRTPQADPTQVFAYGYAEVRTYHAAESVVPLALPQVPVAVAALLP